MKTLFLFLFIFLPAFVFAQTSSTKGEMYRLKSGKPIAKALKDPLNAIYVTDESYTDTIFPNAEILQLKNVEHLVVMGRFCRQKKEDSLLPPLKIHIDTLALKQLTKLRYLELSNFDFHEFPKELCSLTQLKGLGIALCFVDSLPDEIARMKSLQVLEMRLNALHSLPAAFATMDSLVELDFANNRFTEIPPVVLKMKNLHTLVLANIESDMELMLDYHWPYLAYINRIDYAEQHGRLDALLRMPESRKVFIQVQNASQKENVLRLLYPGDYNSKISWRVASMN